jgi:hypothetical protein
MSNTDKYVPPPMRNSGKNKIMSSSNPSKSVSPPMRERVENKTTDTNNSSMDNPTQEKKSYFKKSKPKNTIPPESKWPILQTSYKPTFADVEAIYVNSKEIDSEMFRFGNYAQPPKYFKIPENLDPVVKLGQKLFINSNRISDLNDPEKDKMIRRPTYSTNANYLHYETEETYIFNSPIGKQVMDLLNSYYDDTSKGPNYSGLDPFQFVSSKPGIPLIDESDIINAIDKWKSFLENVILLSDENMILLEECIKERNDILEKTDKTLIRDDEIDKQYVLSLLEQTDVDEIKKDIHKFFIQPLVDLYVKQRDTKFCQEVINMYYPVDFLYEEDGLKYISKDIISYMRVDRKKAIPHEWAEKIINENSELSKKLLEELEKIPDEDLPELSGDYNYFLGKDGVIEKKDSESVLENEPQYKQKRKFSKKEIFENYLTQSVRTCECIGNNVFYHNILKNDKKHSKSLLLENILIHDNQGLVPTLILSGLDKTFQYLYNRKILVEPWAQSSIKLGSLGWNPLLNRAIVSCVAYNNKPSDNLFPIRLIMSQHRDSYKNNKYIKNFNELEFLGFFIIRYGNKDDNFYDYLSSLNLSITDQLECTRKYKKKLKRYMPSNVKDSFDVLLLFKNKSNILDINKYNQPSLILTDVTSRYIDMGDIMHHESYTYMEWNQLQYSLFSKENPIFMWVLLKKKADVEVEEIKQQPIINTFCKSEFDVKNKIDPNNRKEPEDCIESWFSDDTLQLILDNKLKTFSCIEAGKESIHFLFSKLGNIEDVYQELLKINELNNSRITHINLISAKNEELLFPALKITSDIDGDFILTQVCPEWADERDGGTKLEISFGSMEQLKLKYTDENLNIIIDEQVKDEKCLFKRDTNRDIENSIFMGNKMINVDFINEYKDKKTIELNPLLKGGEQYKNNKYEKLIKKMNRMNYLMKLIYNDIKVQLNTDFQIYSQYEGIEIQSINIFNKNYKHYELLRTNYADDINFYLKNIKKSYVTLIQLNHFLNPKIILVIAWTIDLIISILNTFKNQINKVVIIIINCTNILKLIALKEIYINILDFYFIGVDINCFTYKKIKNILRDTKFDTIIIDLGYKILNNNIWTINILILSYLIINTYLEKHGIFILYNILFELFEKQNILLNLIYENFNYIQLYNTFTHIYNYSYEHQYIFLNYKQLINKKTFLLLEKLLENLTFSINIDEYYKYFNLFINNYKCSKFFIKLIIYSFKTYYRYNKMFLKQIINKYNIKIKNYIYNKYDKLNKLYFVKKININNLTFVTVFNFYQYLIKIPLFLSEIIINKKIDNYNFLVYHDINKSYLINDIQFLTLVSKNILLSDYIIIYLGCYNLPHIKILFKLFNVKQWILIDENKLEFDVDKIQNFNFLNIRLNFNEITKLKNQHDNIIFICNNNYTILDYKIHLINQITIPIALNAKFILINCKFPKNQNDYDDSKYKDNDYFFGKFNDLKINNYKKYFINNNLSTDKDTELLYIKGDILLPVYQDKDDYSFRLFIKQKNDKYELEIYDLAKIYDSFNFYHQFLKFGFIDTDDKEFISPLEKPLNLEYFKLIAGYDGCISNLIEFCICNDYLRIFISNFFNSSLIIKKICNIFLSLIYLFISR